jgi:hypothetical protein
VAITDAGLVVAAGAVNTLDQLENLLDEARHRRDWDGDGDNDGGPKTLGGSDGSARELNVLGSNTD